MRIDQFSRIFSDRLRAVIFLGLLWPILAHSELAGHPNTTAVQSVQQVRIGVLALRGIPQAAHDWHATADYLNSRYPTHRFSIVPLPFEQIDASVADGAVDFIIINPAIHIILAERYGVSPVATMAKSLDHFHGSKFGGVIFRKARGDGAPTLLWLKGKRFMAVDRTSFGGFLAAVRELHAAGVNPDKDFSHLEFAGTHDAVVRAVLAGRADAGTVRTGVLEQMAAEGSLDLKQIEIVAPYQDAFSKPGSSASFPYLRSTRLYPEWLMSRLATVPDELTRQVAIALLEMPPSSAAAKNAGITGWNSPMTYIPVATLLHELELPPFERAPFTFKTLVDEQPIAGWLLIGGSIATALFVLVLVSINMRLNRAKQSLVIANRELEGRVRERTKDLEQSNVNLEQLATHDVLTGLLNRRALELRMIDEVNRFNRYGAQLSVLMIDIDHFKNVNDQWGHLTGDHVLKQVARFIMDSVRNTDIVARYGGEEFVALLPMTSPEDAMALAERLCRHVAAETISLDNGEQLRVTVSIGVAPSKPGEGMRWDTLLDYSDQAMYQAKQAGRNRVCRFRQSDDATATA